MREGRKTEDFLLLKFLALFPRKCIKWKHATIFFFLLAPQNSDNKNTVPLSVKKSERLWDKKTICLGRRQVTFFGVSSATLLSQAEPFFSLASSLFFHDKAFPQGVSSQRHTLDMVTEWVFETPPCFNILVEEEWREKSLMLYTRQASKS